MEMVSGEGSVGEKVSDIQAPVVSQETAERRWIGVLKSEGEGHGDK